MIALEQADVVCQFAETITARTNSSSARRRYAAGLRYWCRCRATAAVSRRNPTYGHGKDTELPMPIMVHYWVSLSTASPMVGEGQLLDLSAEGCRIEIQQELSVNTYLSLRLLTSAAELPILIELAAVRWAHGTIYGVTFLDIQPVQAQRLRALLGSARSIQGPASPSDNR